VSNWEERDGEKRGGGERWGPLAGMYIKKTSEWGVGIRIKTRTTDQHCRPEGGTSKRAVKQAEERTLRIKEKSNFTRGREDVLTERNQRGEKDSERRWEKKA